MSTLSDVIENMHEQNPSIIFLTQTSATPFGWAIREAWKTAWPDEKPPKFLTIDVHDERAEMKTHIYSLYDYLFYKTAQPCPKIDVLVRQALKQRDSFWAKVNEVSIKLRMFKCDTGAIVIFDEAEIQCGRSNFETYFGSATTNYVRFVLESAIEQLGLQSIDIFTYGVCDKGRGSSYGFAMDCGPWKRDFMQRKYELCTLPGYRHATTREELRKARTSIELATKLGKGAGEIIKGKYYG